MKEQYQEVNQEMPILKSKYTQAIPLGMFDNFREKLMLYYGRSPERLSTHRGLTVKEALEIFFTSGTMPPEEFYEGALQGEVSIYKQVVAKGGQYGPPVYTPLDYKDCQPAVFKGKIAHLKYMKVVRNMKEAEQRPLPDVLYYISDSSSFYSFEAGVKINRSNEFYAGGMSVPTGEAIHFGTTQFKPELKPIEASVESTLSDLSKATEVKTPTQQYAELVLLRRRVQTLFDAIKHGDEDHQAWLKEAIRCHFAGEPMPEYVAGKSKVGQKVAEFFDNLQSEQKPLDSDIGRILADNRDSLYEGGAADSDFRNIWASGQEAHPSRYIHRPDEPFFVLLGRDPQAPDLIDHWADVREIAEPGDWKIKDARQLAKDMRVFKAANPDFGMSRDLYVVAVGTELSRLGLDSESTSQELRRLYNEVSAEQAARTVPITEIPHRKTVDLDATIGKPVANPDIGLLAQVAEKNPAALPLALQLVNAQPCPSCGYIHTHCRCVTPKEDKPTHLVVSTIPPEWPADHPVLRGEWKLP